MVGTTAQTVIFLHIPKAAGSTLRWIIKRQFHRNQILNYVWWFHYFHVPSDEFNALPAARKAQVKMIMGHLSFGIDSVIPKPSTYITIVRDPVKRVRSAYQHTLRAPGHPAHADVRHMSLKEYVESGVVLDVDNGQTRRIAGVGDAVPYGQCNQEILDLAKQHLRDRFAVVGLTERFDETVLLLQKEFGWRPFYLTKNESKGKRSPRILSRAEAAEADALDTIRRLNQYDVELYHYAVQLFEGKIRQQGPSFAAEVAQFQRFNRYYSHLMGPPQLVLGKIRGFRNRHKDRSDWHIS